MSELKTAGLVLSKLSRAQVFASGDHTARIYGYQISPSRFKIVDINLFTRTAPVVSPGLQKLFRDLLHVLTTDEECNVHHPYTHSDY